jgi:aryl-alcohol dehydrogenase-like predicted oxidoreductase
MGLGTWAIGGPFTFGGQDIPMGWGGVDDSVSLRAIRRAIDLGITFLDTADLYGCGHSERLLGRAVAGRRDGLVLATKFGHVFDKGKKVMSEEGRSDPDYIRSACEASLKRLGTDTIDLYQYHLGGADDGASVRDSLESLVAAGKIRFYGWSTDDPARARVFAEGPHCCAVQHGLNVLKGNDPMLSLCDEFNLASVNRSPLGMGFLTGRFQGDVRLPADDVRQGWDLKTGPFVERRRQLEAVRETLTSGGRTLAQGALAWIWAKHGRSIPIPGCRTVAQVEENAGAMALGPLGADQMQEIGRVLAGLALPAAVSAGGKTR